MNIQSISIVVPTNRCMNDCPFCVSKMHDNEYSNQFSPRDMKKRIKYAAMNGITNCILTGTGEAIQNKSFLRKLSIIFEELDHPFPNVELQTTGVLLGDPDNLRLLKSLGVNNISLSVSDIFDDENNMNIIGVPEKARFELRNIIGHLKNYGFNVRLSLNLTDSFNDHNGVKILNRVKDLGADQLTFRALYKSDNNTPEDKWVEENSANSSVLNDLYFAISSMGTPLYTLPYGPTVYSVMGLSTVLDDDCMSKENLGTLKYVILREDGKLYCRWDDKGSLIF